MITREILVRSRRRLAAWASARVPRRAWGLIADCHGGTISTTIMATTRRRTVSWRVPSLTRSPCRLLRRLPASRSLGLDPSRYRLKGATEIDQGHRAFERLDQA